ncbi:TolC family protein [Melioribacteraceae bacterium 4301-Me]|uniref:TolC family protein n=1 Tax=Pyranulibacter aquaticus TaxID=3163344 RepID=UPI00359BEB5C
MKQLILCLFFIFTMPTLAQKTLTLDDAVKIALQRNPDLIKAKNNLETYKSQLKSAYGDLLPSLGTQATWNWQRINDAGGVQRDFFGNLVNIPPSQTDNRYYQVGFGGSVVLFNGLANWANISKQSDNLEAARLNLEKFKQNIVLQTSSYYYAVLNAEELMKVREENVKYNQKFLETVQERHRLGAVAIADVYSQQVQLGNAELLLIQAQNTYETAKSNLLNYLGLNVLEEYKFVDPYGEKDSINTDKYMSMFDDVTVMVNQALANRKDFKGQQLLLNAAKSGVTIARGGIFPSLTGNYSFGTSATDPNNLFNRKTWSVGLTLSLPIFSNFNTENNIEFAMASEKNAEEDLNTLQRQIKIEIKQGYLDLTAAKKSLDVATKNVVSAEENRKVNQERYNLGSGTILDVLQADRDYTDALRNKIDALYNFYKAKDALMNSLGKLDYKKYE